MALVNEHERTHRAFSWVMRVRTDIAYAMRMPALPPPPLGRVAWVEACGASGPRPAVCPAKNSDGTWGCAKDTWALMTRPAADVYFATPPPGALCRTIPECLLGCALHAGGVVVKVLRRTIARTSSTALPDVDGIVPTPS